LSALGLGVRYVGVQPDSFITKLTFCLFESRVADANVAPIVWSAGSKPDIPEEDDGMRGDDYTPLVQLTVMSSSDIKRFVGHYRQAALNALEAGFDGVEIHGANGYVCRPILLCLIAIANFW
jgi:hypothetical protein